MSFTRTLGFVAVLAALATSMVGTVARADDAAKPAGVRGEMLSWIKDAEEKLVQLAEATPEAKYGWRPGKDVRSTAEVFMHVAAANFGVPSFAGVKPPEGFAKVLLYLLHRHEIPPRRG